MEGVCNALQLKVGCPGFDNRDSGKCYFPKRNQVQQITTHPIVNLSNVCVSVPLRVCVDSRCSLHLGGGNICAYIGICIGNKPK